MFFKYGNHRHDANEAGVTHSIVKRRSGRNRPLIATHRLTVSGKLLSTTGVETDMGDKLQKLIDAYSIDGHDAGLFHSDGSRTPHFLDSRTSINGVRVTDVSFPTSEQVYTTNRDFSVTLEAEYLDTGADDLMEFVESILFIGTGGPRRRLIELLDGVPDLQITNRRTVTRAIQSGHAIGFRARPLPPPPLWPQLQDGPDQRIDLRSPRRDGNQFVDFGIQWTYFFSGITPFRGQPHAR